MARPTRPDAVSRTATLLVVVLLAMVTYATWRDTAPAVARWQPLVGTPRRRVVLTRRPGPERRRASGPAGRRTGRARRDRRPGRRAAPPGACRQQTGVGARRGEGRQDGARPLPARLPDAPHAGHGAAVATPVSRGDRDHRGDPCTEPGRCLEPRGARRRISGAGRVRRRAGGLRHYDADSPERSGVCARRPRPRAERRPRSGPRDDADIRRGHQRP